jgi:uncharacterized protein (DUF488 family)
MSRSDTTQLLLFPLNPGYHRDPSRRKAAGRRRNPSEAYRSPDDPEPAVRIWTVGHSTMPLDRLVKMLRANRIETLIDVRSKPGSRKSPQFNRESLAETIPAASIDYAHLPDLGGFRDQLEGSLNTSWRHPSFRAYADYMEGRPDRNGEVFARGIEELERIASTSRAAFMCSESSWWKCHRRMISDRLTIRWDVQHIMSMTGPTTPHRLTENARIEHGALTYRTAMNLETRP